MVARTVGDCLDCGGLESLGAQVVGETGRDASLPYDLEDVQPLLGDAGYGLANTAGSDEVRGELTRGRSVTSSVRRPYQRPATSSGGRTNATARTFERLEETGLPEVRVCGNSYTARCPARNEQRFALDQRPPDAVRERRREVDRLPAGDPVTERLESRPPRVEGARVGRRRVPAVAG